jgi:hypothetical protein
MDSIQHIYNPAIEYYNIKKKRKKRRKHKKATVSILRSTDILGHNMFYGPMYSSCFNETEYV